MSGRHPGGLASVARLSKTRGQVPSEHAPANRACVARFAGASCLASFASGVCRSFLRLSRRPPFRWCPPGLQFPCKLHDKGLQTGQICSLTPRTTPASWCHGSHPNKCPFCLCFKSRIRKSRLRLDKTRFRQAENPAQTTLLPVPTISRFRLFRPRNVGTGQGFDLVRCVFVPTKSPVPTDVGTFFRECGNALAAPERLPGGV